MGFVLEGRKGKAGAHRTIYTQNELFNIFTAWNFLRDRPDDGGKKIFIGCEIVFQKWPRPERVNMLGWLVSRPIFL